MSLLFSPLTLRSVTARNRIWVAPMCQYSVLAEDGVPTDWHLVHLGSLAAGGAGVVIAEATAVLPEGRISPRDTGLWNDDQVRGWARVVDFIHSQGAAAGIQLAHAGRKASTWPGWGTDRHGSIPEAEGGWTAVAPSPVAYEGYAVPTELDASEIAEIVEAFTRSARRAVDAGFDILEIHAAHGYLVHEFLSPLSNQRDDEFGGSLENRARLLLEIVTRIRAEVGETVPLLVRFSATDWIEGGWTREETSRVAGWAHEAGADLFDISSGALVAGAKIPVGPGYQVPLSEFVRTDANVLTSAVGLITEPQQAENILTSGAADVVMLARALLRDPHWPLRAARELGVDLDYWAPQYARAKLG